MKGRSSESSVARLRQQAEDALRRSRSRNEVEPLLERLAGAAEEGTDAWLFAHRQLAELRLEAHPWRAALHLRHVLKMEDHDDVVHALMGLCHALLGNYRAAVGAYRKALRLAPQNPWYHHNLGHLLDVALSQPGEAEPHLRIAHKMESEEDEITASLAHCLARMDCIDEARQLAQEAVDRAPDNVDHCSLLAWIDDDEPAQGDSPLGAEEHVPGAARVERPGRSRGADRARAVDETLERGMRDAGFSPEQVERAQAMWADFREGRRIRVQKPEVYAAAVEYAICLVHGLGGVTKASVARRYGVAPTSVSSRYGEIRDALELEPGDGRYAGG